MVPLEIFLVAQLFDKAGAHLYLQIKNRMIYMKLEDGMGREAEEEESIRALFGVFFWFFWMFLPDPHKH